MVISPRLKLIFEEIFEELFAEDSSVAWNNGGIQWQSTDEG